MKALLPIISFIIFSSSIAAQDSLIFEYSDSVVLVGQEKVVEFRWTMSGARSLQSFNNSRFDSIQLFLIRNKSIAISIIQHTDTRGSASANQKLSEARANAIKVELVSRGISPDRIEAIGKGESEPIHSENFINQFKQSDPNKFEQLHQINRRTIIRITEI